MVTPTASRRQCSDMRQIVTKRKSYFSLEVVVDAGLEQREAKAQRGEYLARIVARLHRMQAQQQRRLSRFPRNQSTLTPSTEETYIAAVAHSRSLPPAELAGEDFPRPLVIASRRHVPLDRHAVDLLLPVVLQPETPEDVVVSETRQELVENYSCRECITLGRNRNASSAHTNQKLTF